MKSNLKAFMTNESRARQSFEEGESRVETTPLASRSDFGNPLSDPMLATNAPPVRCITVHEGCNYR